MTTRTGIGRVEQGRSHLVAGGAVAPVVIALGVAFALAIGELSNEMVPDLRQ